MNYFTALFALLIGIGCFWISFKLIRLYLQVKKWSRVNATLISKEIILHARHSTSRTPYGLKGEYTYRVNNTHYTGHKIFLAELLAGGQVNLMKSDAEKRLDKMENAPLVFVNPGNPSLSVMYCEGIGLYVFIFFLGILSCLIGLGALLS